MNKSKRSAFAQSCPQTTIILNQATLSGILRGAGKQMTGAIIRFIGYYVIGVAVAAFMVLGMGYWLVGLWSRLLVADVCQVAAMLYIVVRQDLTGHRGPYASFLPS